MAGIVVGESDLSHQILGDILPLRDIFAGLFFVSVGMLVDPWFVLRNLPLLLVTLVLIVLAKGALVTLLSALLGTSARTAVLTGAILAQSAEFSFLLASVGAELGAVSPTVFSLMLAGAAASIVLLPGVYRVSLPLAAWLQSRSPATPSVEVHGAPSEPELQGHVVICGYGRVGQVIGSALQSRSSFIVIEEDPRRVLQLRDQGVSVIQGNAAIPAVLERAGLARAQALIVAIPDPVAVRQIVDYARQHHPPLPVIARTHSEDERRFLLGRGAEEVVLGEHELALEMAHHALALVNVNAAEAQGAIHQLRGQVGAEESERSRPRRLRPPQVRVPEEVE